MKIDWKKIGLKILYPNLAVIICLLPVSIAFLIYSLVYLGTESIIAILSYVLAFYVFLVIGFRMPKIIAFFKKVKHENKFVIRYFSDVQLRMNISLYSSLIFNVAFAIFQLWLGLKNNSLWFYSMFVYYVFLSVMRFFLLKHTKKYKSNEQKEMELKKHNICAILLFCMNIALSVIIFFIVYLNKTFEYHMITTIALASYTFFTFTFAIINIVRYKKYKSPVYSAAKIISLISACVSILTLETTMLTVFGDNSTVEFGRIMLGISGVAVSAVSIALPIMMLVRGTKRLKEKSNNKASVNEIA